jgi:hypothetical protein
VEIAVTQRECPPCRKLSNADALIVDGEWYEGELQGKFTLKKVEGE